MSIEIPGGQQIQTRRKAVGISQTELAKQLKVTTAYISKVEAGHTFPSDELCLRIATALDLSEPATRTLRATALQERTGLKVEDVCPHVDGTIRHENLTGYEFTALEAIRVLDDYGKQQALDFLMWLQGRALSAKEKSTKHTPQGAHNDPEIMTRVIDEMRSIAEKEKTTEDDIRFVVRDFDLLIRNLEARLPKPSASVHKLAGRRSRDK